MNLKIPADISKFKNLAMLLLDNVVESIPDSVCELKSLRFIGLINNKNLKTIPECLADLPNLTFMNFLGSDNLEVPKSIQEKGIAAGRGLWDMSQS